MKRAGKVPGEQAGQMRIIGRVCGRGLRIEPPASMPQGIIRPRSMK